MVKCFYHKADWDGVCSANIVASVYPDAELVGLDYGADEISYCEGDLVYLVDFSLQPYFRMYDLDLHSELVWIDHHKSVMDTVVKDRFRGVTLLEEGTAACKLTWSYFYPEKTAPKAVDLLARYDVGDWSDEVLDFQYGMRCYSLNPRSVILTILLFEEPFCSKSIDAIKKAGKSVRNYQEQEDKNLCKYALEVVFDGKLFIALNTNRCSLSTFKSVYEPLKYSGTLAFFKIANFWVVGLRSENEDMAKIAKKYGGGGHTAAAGFRCSRLPFTFV